MMQCLYVMQWGVLRHTLCKKKKKSKELFSSLILSPGLLVDSSIHYVDGLDKIMVYQSNTFLIVIL